MSAAIRNQLKTYFETGDFPTEGQFGELIDRVALVNEEQARGSFAFTGSNVAAAIGNQAIIEAMSGWIRTPASWTATTPLYVTAVRLQNPLAGAGPGNLPQVYIGTPSGGLHGTTVAVFGNPVQQFSGHWRFSIVSGIAGIQGQLLVTNEGYQAMLTEDWAVPSPYGPGDPQPPNPIGYRSRHIVNPAVVSAANASAGAGQSVLLFFDDAVLEVLGANALDTGFAKDQGGGFAEIILPSGCTLVRATITGTALDCNYSQGAFQNAFVIYVAGNGGTNVSRTNLLLHNPRVYDLGNGASNPSSNNPWAVDPGRVLVYVDKVDGGTIGYVFDRLSNNYQEWALQV